MNKKSTYVEMSEIPVLSDSISSFKRWKGDPKVLGYLPSTYMYTIYFLSPFEILIIHIGHLKYENSAPNNFEKNKKRETFFEIFWIYSHVAHIYHIYTYK